MTAKVFEAALGIGAPWSVASVDFDEAAKVLTVLIDFKSGSRFGISGHEGVHPVHDTVTKTYLFHPGRLHRLQALSIVHGQVGHARTDRTAQG